MENNIKIGFAEALCASLIILISRLILILPKIIIESQGSSSIINIIYTTIILLFIAFLFNKLYKNFDGMDLVDISDFLFGKPFKFIIGLIYISYMIFLSSLILRNTAENLRTMYFQSTPTPYIMFFILFAVALVTKYGLRTTIRCNLIIVPIIILSLIILFILSSGDFVPERIFPILGHGIQNTFVNGISNISNFGNLLLLFFIMPLLKSSKQFSKLTYTSVICSGLLMLIVIGGLLMVFPILVSSGSNVPIYLQTRSITLGKLIQRVDIFFILIWIFNILSYVSIVISFVCMLFQKISKVNNTSRVSYSFVALLFGICLIYKNIIQIRKLDTQAYRILPWLILFLTFAILILASIKKYIRNKKKGVNNFVYK